jgi:hypothetical protein
VTREFLHITGNESMESFTELNPVERSRTYHFDDGITFRVDGVKRLLVRPSGTHRLETTDGRKFVVPVGWLAIELDVDAWTL